MEEKSKKYEDLNVYERAMANAAVEQKIEAMTRELQQIALALKLSTHICVTFCEEGRTYATVSLIPDEVISRKYEFNGDLFGIIEEANKARPTD